MGVDAPAGDLGYFVGLLDSGAFSQASLGLLACQTAFNTGSVGLVGLAGLGLDYIFHRGFESTTTFNLNYIDFCG